MIPYLENGCANCKINEIPSDAPIDFLQRVSPLMGIHPTCPHFVKFSNSHPNKTKTESTMQKYKFHKKGVDLEDHH